MLARLGFSLGAKDLGTTWRSLLYEGFEFVDGKNGVSGWVRRDLAAELNTELLTDPEAFVRTPNAGILKDRPKSTLFTRTMGEKPGRGLRVVVKRVRYASVMRRIGFLFAGSPADRSLWGALILQQKGFDTPDPIAAVGPRVWNPLGTSYYIAEEIQDGDSLRVFWQRKLPGLPRVSTLRKRSQMLRDVADLCHRLHSSGIYHQDLKGTNILVREGKPNQTHRFFLVDVGEVRERSSVPWKGRIRNLVQICQIPGRFWLPRERSFFLKSYADRCGLSKVERKALVRDVSVRIKVK